MHTAYILLKILMGVVVTYVLLPSWVAGCVLRFLKLDEQQYLRIFMISAGMGPIILSWIISKVLWAAPGLPLYFYLFAGLLSILAIACLSKGILKYPTLLWSSFSEFRPFSKPVFSMTNFLWTLLFAVLLMNLYLAISLPVYANDPLQYLIVSKKIIESATIANYPYVNPTAEDGFYAISSHPLGYMTLHAWASLFMGVTHETLLHKLANISYIIFTILLLRGIFYNKPIYTTLFVALILITTPLYFVGASQHAIDVFRIYFLLLGAAWTAELLNEYGARLAVITALTYSLSMFTHSFNVVFTLPLFFGAFALMNIKRPRQVFHFFIINVGMFLLVASQQLIENMVKFGKPITDRILVYNIPHIKYDMYVWYKNAMISRFDIIQKGLLKGLYDLKLFGFSYWLILLFLSLMLVAGFRKKGFISQPIIFVSLFSVSIFYMAVVFSLFLGMHQFVGNSRYLLSLQPFVAILGAYALSYIYEASKKG